MERDNYNSRNGHGRNKNKSNGGGRRRYHSGDDDREYEHRYERRDYDGGDDNHRSQRDRPSYSSSLSHKRHHHHQSQDYDQSQHDQSQQERHGQSQNPRRHQKRHKKSHDHDSQLLDTRRDHDNDQKKKSKRNHHHQPSAALALPASLRLGPDAGAGRRYLCILDLNGVLMARLSHSDHSLAAAAARAANAPFPTAAGTVSRRRLYLRPHAASTFAHWMAAASRVFDFAVWTSAVPENAARITETVFGPEKAERLLKFVWGRDRCDAVDDDASVSWATVKDLKNVYSEFPQYRPDRTLILDDSMAKCSRNPRNALVVPTWDLVHRRPGCVSDHSDEAFDPNQCRVLEHLASYLSAMAHAAPTDVRSWLAERPFAVPFNVLAREGGIIAGGIPRSDGLGTTTTTTNGDVNVDANALLGMPEDHNNYWVVNEEPGFQLPAWAKGADVRGLPDRRSDGDAKHEQQKLKKWTGMVTFDGDDEEATVPIESPSSPVSVTSS